MEVWVFWSCGIMVFAVNFGFLGVGIMLARFGFSGGSLTVLPVFVCALGLLL